jgi:multiple sugar transport system ATP-binding protein
VAAPPQTATIGVRTEHVSIRRSVNGHATGRVKWIEHLGDQNHLHVMIAETEVVTLCDRDADLAVGDAVDVELTAPLFFDASGERLRRQ